MNASNGRVRLMSIREAGTSPCRWRALRVGGFDRRCRRPRRLGRRVHGSGRDHFRSDDHPHDVYDSRGEWVELLNRGDAAAQLGGWRISDGRTENVALPDLTVGPGERIVLARYVDPYVNGGVEADLVYGNQIVLDNTSDRLVSATRTASTDAVRIALRGAGSHGAGVSERVVPRDAVQQE
jgi:hypothetical protein